ncbi:MAG TPA: glycosyltransferase [Planctomycetota bacterium]|nr:glycosyltransferase [Planctomycetota bacterium]
MEIALVSPTHLDVPGGNASAIRRLVGEMQALGHQVSVHLAHDPEPPDTRFEVVHGFHALRGGATALRWAQARQVPAVVTLTGTDVNVDLLQPDTRQEVVRVLSLADGVVALHEHQLQRARELSGLALAASEVIGQGVAVGKQRYRFRTLNGLAEDAFVAFLPAGLRRVKAPHLALEAQRLRALDEPEWELALAGPILEDAYASELLDRMEHLSHARWCGPIASEYMGACYAESDVILNTSESEGISDAIMEAQTMGRPIVARRNAGNESLVEDGVDGLLFETSGQLARALCRLQRDADLRLRLGRAAKSKAKGYPTPRQEAEAHLELYRRLGA